MADKTVHVYEIHAKSPATKGWKVYETHDNESSAVKAANKYVAGATKLNKKNFQVKIVKVATVKTKVSENLITPPKAAAPKAVKKSNLDKMVDPEARPHARTPRDPKAPVTKRPRRPKIADPVMPTSTPKPTSKRGK